MNVVADHEGTTRQTIASEGVGRVNSASSPWVNTGANLWVSDQSATSLPAKVHSVPECQQGMATVNAFWFVSKGAMLEGESLLPGHVRGMGLVVGIAV